MRNSELLRYVIGPHPAERDSFRMWGVKTLSMSLRDNTSLDVPSALSGSKVLIACPCVASILTVPTAELAGVG